jgi:hypothetical protein
MAAIEKLPTKFVTPEIICSFPKLAEMEEFKGKKSYSLKIMLPADDKKAMADLKQAMVNAAINEWGQKAAELKGIKNFITDGDADDEITAGMKCFSAKAYKKRPGCVFPNLAPVPQEMIEEVFYPGAIIRASITAYAVASEKQIAFALNNVMFVKDGQRFGGGPSNPEDDFADFKSEVAEDIF